MRRMKGRFDSIEMRQPIFALRYRNLKPGERIKDSFFSQSHYNRKDASSVIVCLQKMHCYFSAKIFQKTKCSMCNSPLELPSVHFLCGHSFHQHCLESFAESEAECPTCTPENRKVMDMLRAQDQKRDLHDHFHRQVLIFLLKDVLN